jgi:hypothetical protein
VGRAVSVVGAELVSFCVLAGTDGLVAGTVEVCGGRDDSPQAAENMASSMARATSKINSLLPLWFILHLVPIAEMPDGPATVATH